MRKILFISTVLAMMMCISCVQKPKFIELKNVVIDGIKDSLMVFSLDYVAYNPNNVKSTLKGSKMEVYFEDQIVGDAYVDKQISLTANDTIVTPVRFEVTLAKLSEFYPKILASDSIFFKLHGNSKIDFMFTTFDVKINEEVILDVKNLLKNEIRKNITDSENFKINGLRVNTLPTLDQTVFEMQLGLKNNFTFDYTINDLQIDIHHKNQIDPFAYWRLENSVLLRANASTSIPVEVVLDNFNIVKQMNITWFLNQKADFDISGVMNIEIRGFSFEIPIEDQITFEF